ncbi:MAG: hypothetical protein AAF846_16595 [Chloroflexota bacterium]
MTVTQQAMLLLLPFFGTAFGALLGAWSSTRINRINNNHQLSMQSRLEKMKFRITLYNEYRELNAELSVILSRINRTYFEGLLTQKLKVVDYFADHLLFSDLASRMISILSATGDPNLNKKGLEIARILAKNFNQISQGIEDSEQINVQEFMTVTLEVNTNLGFTGRDLARITGNLIENDIA